MSLEKETFFSKGIVFIIIVLLIVSGFLSVLLVKPDWIDGDGKDGEEDNWEPTPYQPYIEPQFSGVLAEHFLKKQLGFGYRVPGTIGHKNCRDYIRDSMNELGYDVSYQNFSERGINSTNIVARLNSDENYPEAKNSTKDTFILGAHYDTRPYSELDQKINAPIKGANDGASGVAILLELARVFSVNPANINLEFVFFDMEDHGDANISYCVGSEYYANSLSNEKKEQVRGAIVVDMVGDKDLDIYYENNSHKKMRENIWKEAVKLDFNEFHKSEKYDMFDDHKNLIDVGIPSVLLIDFDYPHWHTQNDTIDKISGESLEKVGRTVEKYIYKISGYNKLKAAASDLTIPMDEEKKMEQEVRHINGNITVNGTLRLRNTMLVVNSEPENEHSIIVNNNGSLIVENSIITSPKKSLIFRSYGSCSIKNSTVENLWGNTKDKPYIGGIQLFSPDTQIENTTIRYSNTRGIFIDTVNISDEPIIIDSDIEKNGEVGLYLKNSKIAVEGATFFGNGRGGIYLQNSGINLQNSHIRESKRMGSCTTGDCSGPDPTIGILIRESGYETIIRNNTFFREDTAIKANHPDGFSGDLQVENNNFDRITYGISLTNTSADIFENNFSICGVPVYSELGNPTIRNNTMLDSTVGIHARFGMGRIRGNQIRNCSTSGIVLDTSEFRIENNIIINSTSGITMLSDHGSSVTGNMISANNIGVFSSRRTASGNISISGNMIFDNLWGIHIIGDKESIISHNNSFEKDGKENQYGPIRQERELIIFFENNSADVTMNISYNGTQVHTEEIAVWFGQTKVNLTLFEKFTNGTEKNYANYSFEVSTVNQQLPVEEVNIGEKQEILFKFGD